MGWTSQAGRQGAPHVGSRVQPALPASDLLPPPAQPSWEHAEGCGAPTRRTWCGGDPRAGTRRSQSKEGADLIPQATSPSSATQASLHLCPGSRALSQNQPLCLGLSSSADSSVLGVTCRPSVRELGWEQGVISGLEHELQNEAKTGLNSLLFISCVTARCPHPPSEHPLGEVGVRKHRARLLELL